MGIKIREKDVNLLLKSFDVSLEADEKVIRFFEKLNEQIRRIQTQKIDSLKAESKEHNTEDEEEELLSYGIEKVYQYTRS